MLLGNHPIQGGSKGLPNLQLVSEARVVLGASLTSRHPMQAGEMAWEERLSYSERTHGAWPCHSVARHIRGARASQCGWGLWGGGASGTGGTQRLAGNAAPGSLPQAC